MAMSRGRFVDGWVRVGRDDPTARQQARHRFLEPLLDYLTVAGLGHASEIADVEAPFTSRGCPFQAWSLGELLRLERAMLSEPRESRAYA